MTFLKQLEKASEVDVRMFYKNQVTFTRRTYHTSYHTFGLT